MQLVQNTVEDYPQIYKWGLNPPVPCYDAYSWLYVDDV